MLKGRITLVDDISNKRSYAYYYSLRLDALEYVKTGDIHPILKYEITQLCSKMELQHINEVIEFILNESVALPYYEKTIR